MEQNYPQPDQGEVNKTNFAIKQYIPKMEQKIKATTLMLADANRNID